MMVASAGLFACSEKARTGEPGGTQSGTPAASSVFAVPQEELMKMPGAIKLSGSIAVKDYSSGLLQVDVTVPTSGGATPQGSPPITVARFKGPGPYELLLPPKTSEVSLTLILDLKGDGPSADDPKSTYDKNPVKISGSSVTGIDLSLATTVANPPPPGPEGQKSTPAPAVPANDALSTTAAQGKSSPVPVPAAAPASDWAAAPGKAVDPLDSSLDTTPPPAGKTRTP